MIDGPERRVARALLMALHGKDDRVYRVLLDGLDPKGVRQVNDAFIDLFTAAVDHLVNLLREAEGDRDEIGQYRYDTAAAPTLRIVEALAEFDHLDVEETLRMLRSHEELGALSDDH
jgi:hypothetical protein